MMDLILKKYSNPQDAKDSDLIKKLHLKGNTEIEALLNSQERLGTIYNKLCSLLGWKLHQPYFVMINKVWWNTKQWIGIVDKASISEEQENWLNNISSSFDCGLKSLISWQKNSDILPIFAFIYGAEPDFKPIFEYHAALKELISFCGDEIKFRRGGKYSKDKIQRYGVYSLFYLGEAIGLDNLSRPSALYQLVHIVTNLDLKDISDYYTSYKKADLLKEIQNSRVFEYIFSPDNLSKELNNKMFPYKNQCSYKQTNLTPLTLPIFPSVGG